jgi:hypothetical protein
MKPWHELREFKAGLARVDSITKDLLKLVREEVEAGWFHVLVNYKPRTVKALFGKFSEALAEVGPHIAAAIRPITFAVCVLSTKELFQATSVLGGPSCLAEFDDPVPPSGMGLRSMA